VPRKRTAPEEWPYEKAKEAYSSFGKLLYGAVPGSEKASKKDRRKWVFGRRMLEGYYPRLRSEEKDTYREGSSGRELPVPRMTIEFTVTGQAGNIIFPDGSRKQYRSISFSSRDSLLNALAKLINDRLVDPERTVVIVGGSAQPLLTLVDQL
jgi:hypothetical protein